MRSLSYFSLLHTNIPFLQWFGLVLLPLISYAGDGLNTTMYFIRTHLFSQDIAPPDDFAKAKNIDLAIQFTLFWIPVLVLASWAVNMPLGLLFGAPFNLTSLYIF